MMERYTPQAQEALGLAVGVAETLNHGYVGTEHLLIGLLQEGTGVAAKVLEENGVEEDRAHSDCHAEGRGLCSQPPSQHHRGQYTEALYRSVGSHG